MAESAVLVARRVIVDDALALAQEAARDARDFSADDSGGSATSIGTVVAVLALDPLLLAPRRAALVDPAAAVVAAWALLPDLVLDLDLVGTSSDSILLQLFFRTVSDLSGLSSVTPTESAEPEHFY